MIETNIKTKIKKIIKNESLRKYLSWTILGFSLLFSLITYLIFSGVDISQGYSRYIFLILYIDLLLFLLLAGLVIRKIVKLWLEKRRNISGSGLHVKLAMLFMIVAGLPTILITSFSVIFFNVAIKSWFSDQVQNAVASSLIVAEDYYKENRQMIANDALVIATEIVNNVGILDKPDNANKFLLNNMQRQDISELVIVDALGNVIVQAGDMSSLKTEVVPKWIFAQADSGNVAVNINEGSDKIRALKLLQPNLYLYVGRSINSEIISHINKAKIAIENYENAEGQRSFLEFTFTFIFIVISLILLLVVVWIGLSIASAMLKPIASLVNASEKMAKGEKGGKIPELDSSDEMAQLVVSFNNMISEIESQKNELIEKSNHIDERRRLIEAILSGVSSGVVNVNKDMIIRVANIRACELLGNLNDHKGEQLDEVIPELKPIIHKLQESLFKNIQENIELNIGGFMRRFLVRVVGAYNDKDVGGYVFTFDDMTELEDAQRKAAWGDVARRIAHEIKNPLTPIQLSAERLLKKYGDKIGDEAFLTCVNTIIRQVHGIGKMVDEFAKFAKMPSPQMKKNALGDIVNDVILLQKTTYPFIKYEFSQNKVAGKITCDKEQISQVIFNLLKNAAESIITKQEQDVDFVPFIKVSLNKDEKYVITTIEDNGKGIMETDLYRITEPYVTTKEKGTGIGLAIVKKIIEDHKGTLKIENRTEGGVKVIFTLEV